MADDLFGGLPPPSTAPTIPSPPSSPRRPPSAAEEKGPPADPPAPPRPALKSALKRGKPADSQPEARETEKRLRFKTTTDATETQVIEAMQKISSHIKNRSKFSKASKLALQLVQAGSVKNGTSDHFFAILEAAMSSAVSFSDPALRGDYQALFSAAQDVKEFFSKQQRNHLTTWTLKAVVANELHTDDSFVFSKAAGKIKDAISALPMATAEDDIDEAENLAKSDDDALASKSQDMGSSASASLRNQNEEALDPFGLDVLLGHSAKKKERASSKKMALSNEKAESEEYRRFLRCQREALILCLEAAGRRYRIPWAQTVIDILVKHAFDNVERFTTRQRDAVEKLWTSIKEQQIRRKQGKSVTGKLDMNAFEWLQEKYANEKISIRHSVGGGGERRAQQWLG